MEYCPHGNLRQFLRSTRSLFKLEKKSLVIDLSNGIGPNDLIYFAWQIAKGMTFLISRKVRKLKCHFLANECMDTLRVNMDCSQSTLVS